jgi:hypothetical protein
MLPVEEFNLYGKFLDGTETELERAKLARARFLKLKMRDRLAAEIGDPPDNITDTLRAVLITYAVGKGLVTDAAIIQRLDAYVEQAIAGYGGAEGIMDVLEAGLDSVGRLVVGGYFVAKAQIKAAETEEEVMGIDIDPGPPPETA